MIIKAKYPKVGNKYVGYQRIGSLHGGNQVSEVTNIDSRESNGSISNDRQSEWA